MGMPARRHRPPPSTARRRPRPPTRESPPCCAPWTAWRLRLACTRATSCWSWIPPLLQRRSTKPSARGGAGRAPLPPPPPSSSTDGGGAALGVVDRVRRRLRANGYRCHMTLQAVPARGAPSDADDAPLAARLHITPLRASRALALRYLATRWSVAMDDVTLVTAPADVVVGVGAGSGGAAAAPPPPTTPHNPYDDDDGGPVIDIAPHTSDLVELASGACPVRVLLPAGAARARARAARRARAPPPPPRLPRRPCRVCGARHGGV